jgi:hypothetical protein
VPVPGGLQRCSVDGSDGFGPLIPAASSRAVSAPVWRHDVRGLDVGGRVVVPEFADLFLADGRPVAVAAALRGGCWVLRPARRAGVSSPLSFGGRSRLVVPRGVRHHLGVQGAVGVSIDAAACTIIMWTPTVLDALVAEVAS